MERKVLLRTTIILTGILFLSLALLFPWWQAQAQGPDGADSAVASQGDVGTTITYQGRLTKANGPVNGRCDFTFKLWTAASGGQQAGSTVTKSNVQVRNGNFTVELDFGEGLWNGPSTFSGQARWMSVDVRCPAGQGSFTTLNGRVALNPAPYALSLRPGAVVVGAPSNKTTITGIYTGSGASSAVRGINNSPQGTGVYGWATANNDSNYGVYGRTDSGSGYGVYGEAHHTSGGYGVYGVSASGHGVHGKANPPDGYAIYSEGNTFIEGKLFWSPLRSVIAIPTSAFIPEQLNDAGNVPYDNEGYYLKNESTQNEWFTAPVQLPHGALITKLNVGWRDGSEHTAQVVLRRRSFTDFSVSFDSMANVRSVGTSHSIRSGVWSDDTIDFAYVDNERYIYYLEASMPPVSEDIMLYGVTIEYEVFGPY